VIGDHAVLQRDRPFAIRGEAKAGEALTITFQATSVSTRADKSGAWHVNFPAVPASVGSNLVIAGESGSRVIKDVAFGDVFLCAGQSNMAFPVRQALDYDGTLQDANDDGIRLLTVPEVQNSGLGKGFDGALVWNSASSATVGDWSAVCYFFARERRKASKIPIGLIVAARSGTHIQSWLSETALKGLCGYEGELQALSQFRSNPAQAINTWLPGPRGARLDVPDISKYWEDWGVPELSAYDGGLWYHATFENGPTSSGTLNLGTIDGVSAIRINQTPIAYRSVTQASRTFAVPAHVLRDGHNEIDVFVLDTYRKGGFYGPQKPSFNGHPLSQWRYSFAEPVTKKPAWDAHAGVATLFDRMIAPLEGVPLSAVIWYQGESNVEESEIYERLLSAMTADWRQVLGESTPFVIIQLPKYGPLTATPARSKRAELRDAQRRAVAADPHAALVVTIDQGEADDLHPANKLAVAKRVKLSVEGLVYGKPISASGPQPVSASLAGQSVHFTFSETVVAYGNDLAIGFQLCEAKTCVFASANLSKDAPASVSLLIPKGMKPDAVRYCWADSPICNMFDALERPVTPFQASINGKGQSISRPSGPKSF
jgi:sialate O-acetylesterase